MTSGFTAIYFFIYAIHFYATKLEIEGFISMFLYFGYTFIMCFLFFLLTGNNVCNWLLQVVSCDDIRLPSVF